MISGRRNRLSGNREELRLQKLVAASGVCSRREADRAILEGRVTVNGETVVQPGHRVRMRDRIELDGKELTPADFQYLMLNKPDGCICTRQDTEGRKTVYAYLPELLARLAYVGRLDYNTRGVLLFTNDGELTFRLTRPEFKVEKEYLSWVRGNASQEDLERLRQGVHDGGEYLHAKEADIVEAGPRRSLIRVVLTEGRYREVKRMFGGIRLTVLKLERISFAGLNATGLQTGRWRHLTSEEVRSLYRLVDL